MYRDREDMCEHDMCSIFRCFFVCYVSGLRKISSAIGYVTAMTIEIIIGHHKDSYIETTCL